MSKYVKVLTLLKLIANDERCLTIEDIKDLPPEDVKPVEYGRWKCIAIGHYECTNCGYEPFERTQYCGHCGALMDEETTEQKIIEQGVIRWLDI